MCKLGVNIDHIATLRNARGENHPNLIQAVRVLEECMWTQLQCILEKIEDT